MGRLFDATLPTALRVGMSPSDYWDGDPWLFSAYDEADRQSEERAAWDRWALGMYVYDALARTSPLVNAFSKTHKAEPWVDRPYELTKPSPESPEEAERQAHERTREWLLSLNVDV